MNLESAYQRIVQLEERLAEMEAMNDVLNRENAGLVAELRHTSFVAETRFQMLTERRKEIQRLGRSVQELTDLVHELRGEHGEQP